MSKINFHVHSTGSDGALSPEEGVKEAIRVGITHICFTDHTGIKKEVQDFGKEITTDDYIQDVLKLKETYKGKIEIYLGAELDWIDSFKDWTKKIIASRNYDFILGSVHFVPLKGKYITMGYSDKFWKNILDNIGAKDFVKAYFYQLRLMIKSKMYDSIAHFDVVKLGNVDNKYFNQDEDWYRKEVLDTLDEVKKSGMAIEINASGWILNIKEQHPSEWILKEAFERKIPITIGNDFHGKNNGYKEYEEIDTNLERAYALAKEIGWKKVCIFKNRKREEVEL